MNIKILVILLVMGLVLGTYSISNYAMAASQDIGKIAPTDKISPSASPPGFEKAGMVRVISSTTSEQGISDIQQKGCSVVHRLNDATSFSCPSGVVGTIDNVRPVKVYQPHDLDADIQINADDVWDLTLEGTGVKVAVLDTGVQASHYELSDNGLLTLTTHDLTELGGDDEDSNGHGTHVSGIVTSNGVLSYDGGSTKGVAPSANVLVGKVCGVEFCLEDDIVAGIMWAVDQGAVVINMSLGGGLTGAENCDGDDDKVVDAVNIAADDGIVFTISSGNNGSKFGVSYPACASGAIAVGAVNSSDKIASFSNTGPAMDIVAPGVSILSTYSCHAVASTNAIPNPCDFTWAATLSGTSMSSPHVAGVVALMLEKNPTLTVDQVKDALYSTAKKIQSGNFDGNGRVDALGAVNYEPTTSNQSPIANAGADQQLTDTDGNGSESVTLDGTESNDPDGTIADPAGYSWKEGETLLGTGSTLGHAFAVGEEHTVTLTVTDNEGAQDTDTVIITVNPVNDAPVADIQSVSTDEDTALSIILTATDADGDSLTYTTVSGPSNGSLSGTAPNLTYTPDPDFNGDDFFTFKANDGIADSDPATISITVKSVNDDPVADSQSVSTDESTALSITLTATDADGNSLAYTIISDPLNGSLEGTVPNLTYTPDSGFIGSDSFTFKANDGIADSNTAIISITVNAVSQGISVTSITPYSMSKGTTMSVMIIGSGFEPGASVTLENGCGPSPSASTFSVSDDGTEIIADITTKSGGPNKNCAFDVRVTNTDTSTGVGSQFTVLG